MSAETDLYTAIQSVVSGKVYPGIVPEGTELPYIEYERTGSIPQNVLNSITPALTAVQLQVSIWAETLAAAQTLRDSVLTALASSPVVLENDDNFVDFESDNHRVQLDLTFWET